jgi:hypothetical protein
MWEQHSRSENLPDLPVMADFAELWRLPEYRALWFGRGLSLVGDQLARVAVSILVFTRTGSPVQTAIVYSATYLPYLVGPWAGAVADRRSRRHLMIGIDLARAAALTFMSLPDTPLPAVIVLLALTTALSPTYDAARSATLPDVLPSALYPTGLALFTVTTEAAQVLGFAVGGAIVAAVGSHAALGFDAATFAFTALVTTIFLTERPAPEADPSEVAGSAQSMRHLIWRSATLRRLVFLAWLNAFWVAPEGLAAPYCAQLHAGAKGVGFLLAAIPLGASLGALALLRLPPERRQRLMPNLALLAAVPLIGCALHPNLIESFALWTACGLGTSYNLPANVSFIQAIPAASRARAFATVTTGLVAGQGLSILLAGAAAEVLRPSTVVAIAGGIATVLALAIRPRPRSAAYPRPLLP